MDNGPQSTAPRVVEQPERVMGVSAGELQTRRWVVLGGIIAMAGLLLLCMGLIYWRSWVRRPALDAAVIIQGEAGSVGVSVLIEASSASSETSLPKTWSRTISEADGYRCQVAVPPGLYRIHAELNGEVYGKPEELLLRPGRTSLYRVAGPTTRKATEMGAAGGGSRFR